jgi:hypothetical protein
MSAAGSMWIGTVGAVVFLLGVFAFSQGNWKGGVRWLLVGVAVISILTYMDKPVLMVWP